MDTLSTSTGGRRSGSSTGDFGIGAEQHVHPAVGDEADGDGTKVRVLARHAGTVGPSTRTRSLPIAYSRPGRAVTIGARRSIASATAARSREQTTPAAGRARRGRGCWSGRLPPHRCDPAADVSARATTTRGHRIAAAVWPRPPLWALVVEHAPQHLQQRGVSLADVQERDVQPCGRPDAEVGRRAPGERDEGCDSREDCHSSRSPRDDDRCGHQQPAGEHSERRDQVRQRRDRERTRPGTRRATRRASSAAPPPRHERVERGG